MILPPLRARVRVALQAMQDGDVRRAASILRHVQETTPSPDTIRRGLESHDLWDAFVRLVGARGYFTSTHQELFEAFAVIREAGVGFDLFELAQAMVQFDPRLAGSLGWAADAACGDPAACVERCSDCVPSLRPSEPIGAEHPAPPSLA